MTMLIFWLYPPKPSIAGHPARRTSRKKSAKMRAAILQEWSYSRLRHYDTADMPPRAATLFTMLGSNARALAGGGGHVPS